MSKTLPEYLAYFLSDMLQNTGEYTTKRMFSGYGIYFHGKIFAFYTEESIFFKTHSHNKKEFIDAGGIPFSYQKQGKNQEISYYKLPEEILEEREELGSWIQKSLDY